MQEKHPDCHPHNIQAEKSSRCSNADHQKFCNDIWYQIIYQSWKYSFQKHFWSFHRKSVIIICFFARIQVNKSIHTVYESCYWYNDQAWQYKTILPQIVIQNLTLQSWIFQITPGTQLHHTSHRKCQKKSECYKCRYPYLTFRNRLYIFRRKYSGFHNQPPPFHW